MGDSFSLTFKISSSTFLSSSLVRVLVFILASLSSAILSMSLVLVEVSPMSPPSAILLSRISNLSLDFVCLVCVLHRDCAVIHEVHGQPDLILVPVWYHDHCGVPRIRYKLLTQPRQRCGHQVSVDPHTLHRSKQ